MAVRRFALGDQYYLTLPHIMALIYGVWVEKLYQSVSKAGSGGLSYKKGGFDYDSGIDPGYNV